MGFYRCHFRRVIDDNFWTFLTHTISYREREGKSEMGNAAEGCCGLRSPDQVRDGNDSNVSNEDRRRNFIVRVL